MDVISIQQLVRTCGRGVGGGHGLDDPGLARQNEAVQLEEGRRLPPVLGGQV